MKSHLSQLHSYFWNKGFLAWKLHNGQLAIYEKIRAFEKHQKEALVFCARRFGKSTLGVILALEDCLQREGQVRIIGPTIKQTISIVEPIIRKMTLDAPQGLIHRIKSEYRWQVGSSELIVGGFDGQNITRHLGQESISIYLEESGASRAQDFTYAVVEVLTPHLLHTEGYKIHLTTPPKDLNHPLIKDVLPRVQDLQTYFFATIFDNPLLTKEQIQSAIEESGGEDTAAFQRNYLCQLVKDTDTLVVPQFDASVHTFKEKKTQPLERVYVVGDWGGVRDKTSILFVQRFQNTLVVHRELFFENHTPSEIIFQEIEKVRREENFVLENPWVLDAPPALTIDWQEKHQVIARIPLKKPFEEGVSLIRQAFFRDHIHIHRSCDYLIKSCLYGRLKAGKDFERTEFLGHCDCLAALIYAYRLPSQQTYLDFQFFHRNAEKEMRQDALLQALKKKQEKIQEQKRLELSGMKNLNQLFKNRMK